MPKRENIFWPKSERISKNRITLPLPPPPPHQHSVSLSLPLSLSLSLVDGAIDKRGRQGIGAACEDKAGSRFLRGSGPVLSRPKGQVVAGPGTSWKSAPSGLPNFFGGISKLWINPFPIWRPHESQSWALAVFFNVFNYGNDIFLQFFNVFNDRNDTFCIFCQVKLTGGRIVFNGFLIGIAQK